MSTVCPMPAGHSPADAHAMFLKKKKEMPGLTPAAWRKAAAQEMGLGYDVYLALWKAHKGVAKAVKMVPASTPTVPAASAPGATMGIPLAKPAVDTVVKATAQKIHKILGEAGLKKYVAPKAKYTHTGQMMQSGAGYNGYVVKEGMDYQEWQFFITSYDNKGDEIAAALKKMGLEVEQHGVATVKVKSGVLSKVDVPKKAPYDEAFEAIDDLKAQVKLGTLDAEDVEDIMNDMMTEYGSDPITAAMISHQKKFLKISMTEKAKEQVAAKVATAAEKGALQADEIFAKFEKGLYGAKEAKDELLGTALYWDAHELDGYIDDLIKKLTLSPADDVIQTAYGPLTHDLAQSVYKDIKKQMPSATPAQWRHAAAQQLGVDYNDYLKAWKKPTTAAQKSAVKSAPSVPKITEPPLSPSAAGKYAKMDITPDELKVDLAKLYGPGGNPNYIDLVHDMKTGKYQVTFPAGLTQGSSSAVTQGIVKGLEDLGLKVKQVLGPNTWEIKSPAWKKPPAPAPLNLTNPYNTFTYHDGLTVLDIPSGNNWTMKWWQSISASAQKGVKRYTTNAYRTINSKLRSGGALTGDMKAMSQAMPRTTKEFTVFRGCGDEFGRSLTIDAFTEGELFEDLGFMSTAVTPEAAWRGVKLTIHLPVGTKGMYIDYVSSARGEMEYLLDAGTKFRVLSVKKGHGPMSGEVELVAIPH